MSLKSVKRAVKKSRRDDFAVNTIIRWISSGRYTYVAVKTNVGWFTTARYGNSFVPQTPSFDELMVVLARAETTDVVVIPADVGTPIEP